MDSLRETWQKWFRNRGSEPPDWPTRKMTSREAITLLEGKICTTVFGLPKSEPAHNLYGEKVTWDCSPRPLLARAAGVAIAGNRVALYLSEAPDYKLLRSYRRDGASLVLHVDANAVDSLGIFLQAKAADIPTLFAEDGNSTVQFVLAARHIAECWLTPVVVISRMDKTESIAFPEDPELTERVPAAASETTAHDHTRFLFGETRRQVASLFHPQAALTTGLQVTHAADAAAAQAGEFIFSAEQELNIFLDKLVHCSQDIDDKSALTIVVPADYVPETRIAQQLLASQGVRTSLSVLRSSHQTLPLPANVPMMILGKTIIPVGSLYPLFTLPVTQLYQQALPSGPCVNSIAAAANKALSGSQAVITGGLHPPGTSPCEERKAFDQELQKTFPQVETLVSSALAQEVDSENRTVFVAGLSRSEARHLGQAHRKLTSDYSPFDESFWLLPQGEARSLTAVSVVSAATANRFADLAWRIVRGGRLIVAEATEDAQLALPAAWRIAAATNDILLESTSLSIEQVVAAASKNEPFHTRSILIREEKETLHIPVRIRKRSIGDGAEDLTRHFGLQRVPRRAGYLPTMPDPFAARGWTASGGYWLHDQRPTLLPQVEAARCSGCGACAAACPDSAIMLNVQSLQSWLDGACQAANLQTLESATLKRGHRKVAKTLIKEITESSSLSEASLQSAFATLIEGQKWDEEKLLRGQTAATATITAAMTAQPMITQILWHDPVAAGKDGSLLFLAVDSERCRDCGICMDLCPEDALYPEPAEKVSDQRWNALNDLPDTHADLIASLDENEDTAPGWAYSRHLALTVAGGDNIHIGSGGQIALRSLLGSIEYHGQPSQVVLGSQLDAAAVAVQDALLETLKDGLHTVSPEDLEKSIGTGRGVRESLSNLFTRLEQDGESAPYARQTAVAMAAAARSARTAADLLLGRGRPERTRCGIVAFGPEATSLMGVFPDTIVDRPLRILDETCAGELAGILRAWQEQHLAIVRDLRRAQLYAKPPSDLPRQIEKLTDLAWRDLAVEEKAAAPALLVLTDSASVARLSLQDLLTISHTGLPVVVAMLATFDSQQPFWPLAEALGWPALSGSIHAPNTIHRFLTEQLLAGSPAFLRILAPEPLVTGIPTCRTVALTGSFCDGGLYPLAEKKPGQPPVRTAMEADPVAAARWLTEIAINVETRTVTETGTLPSLEDWLVGSLDSPFWYKNTDAVTRVVSPGLAQRLAAFRDEWQQTKVTKVASVEASPSAVAPSTDPTTVATEPTTPVPDEAQMIARLRSRLLELAGSPGARG